MGLADIVVRTEEIEAQEVPGGKFAVRGLTVVDIDSLARTSFEDMTAVLRGDANRKLSDVLRQFPELGARIIATAADEPEAWRQVATLPLGTQVRALRAVWRLSAITPEELGNVVSDLISALDQVADHIPEGLSRTISNGPKRPSSTSSQRATG